jgi:erythromycin esterase
MRRHAPVGWASRPELERTVLSRRSLLAGAAALAATARAHALDARSRGSNSISDAHQARPNGGRSAAIAPEERVRRIGWLDRNAAQVRSIDFADDDFSDLEPLRRAIGSARIVLLGEQTHGDGTAFAAKSRVVRFLHEQMGFDVLAFESGFYDMPKAWRQIRAGKSVRSAVRGGLYTIWSRSAEMQPLIDYIGARASADRPLELTGFDCKFTNSGSADVTEQLTAVLDGHGVHTDDIEDWARFSGILDNLSDGTKFGAWRPSEEDHRVVVATADVLIDRLAGRSTIDIAYWRQLLRSIKGQSEFLLKLDVRKDTLDQVMLRDIPMGGNLVWLARERYPRRRIIVWAASLHTMRNLHLMDPGLKHVRLMGDLVWDAFGAETYSIGFTAYQGARGEVGRHETPIGPADPDSLEGLWGATAQSNAFLDLRRLAAGGDWLDQPVVSDLLNGRAYPLQARKLFDAAFFIRAMRRSTLAE